MVRMVRRQSVLRAVVAALVCAVAALAGCGGMPAPAPVVSAPADTNLNGNWLLVGTLPFASVTGTPQNNNFGVAGTFAVSGANVVGALTVNIPCPGGGISGPAILLSGVIASDGSFSLQPLPSAVPATATVTGSVPASGANTWSGHLTMTTGYSCSLTQSIDFTAVRIANVTGTYTGMTTMGANTLNALSMPVTLTLSLQQGGGTNGAEALTGTISLLGNPCLTSGTVQFGSGVLGAVVSVSATMNDGSSAILSGQILNTGVLSLNMSGGLFSGGTCGTYLMSPVTVIKQ